MNTPTLTRLAALERIARTRRVPLPTSALDLAGRIGLALDPWQQDVAASRARRIALLCSRQSGKTFVSALLAYATALTTPGALVLIIAPAQRQAVEALRAVLDFHQQLAGAVPSEAEAKMHLELANGARVLALPGAERTIRGFSAVDLLVIDEAARVEDDLYRSVRPMLAVSGGRIVALSTPFARAGWFYEAWTEGDGWERYEIPAARCPRISAAFLEEERRSLPGWVFAREYACQFSDLEGQVFRDEAIAAMFSDEATPLFQTGAA